MRRFFMLLLFVSFSGLVSGQTSYKNLPLVPDKVTVNYPDHTVIAKVQPVSKEIFPDTEKFYYWYSANQIKTTQGGFSGKLLNGTYTDFYLNKNLKEQGEFKNGLRYGQWSTWSDNGLLKEKTRWYAGQKSGRYSLFGADGKLAETGKYKKGLLNGKQLKFDKEGKGQVVYYKKGQTYQPKHWHPKLTFLNKLFKHKKKK